MLRRRLAAALALLVAAAAHARADVLVVVTGADDPANPPEGSLRHVLTKAAKAGDTIRFAHPVEVTISERAPLLEIPAELTGLRIEGFRNGAGPGAVTIRGGGRTVARIRVAASGVVLEDLDFLRTSVEVRDPAGTVSGVHVSGCRFAGFATVEARGAADCVIEGNEFDLDGRQRGAAIDLLASTAGCRVAGNTFRLRASVEPRTAVAATSARSCVIEDNVFEGCSLFAVDFQGVVRRNRAVTGSFRIASGALAATFGPIDVEENDVLWLSLFANGGGTVRRNRIGSEATGLPAGERPQTSLRVYTLGTMTIEQNEVRAGRRTSVQVTDGPGTEAVVVRGNSIASPGAAAVRVSTSAATRIEANTIDGTGSACRDGILIVRAPSEGALVEGNSVAAVRRTGITVFRDQRARLVGNTVEDCGELGIAAGTGARMDVEGGVVERSREEGVFFSRKSTGTVTGTTVRGNGGAGIYVDAGARVDVARVSVSSNGGPGIDLAPSGVTPNARRRTGNDGVPFPIDLVFDDATGRIAGKSEAGARVDAYAVEEGGRAGNPANGEGVAWLGSVVADVSGSFTFPAGGRAPCPPSSRICFTATRLPTGLGVQRAPVTSEFSGDVECSPGSPIQLVSRSSTGAPGNGSSLTGNTQGVANRSVSEDGRRVVFASAATNLVDGDTNGLIDVFLRDTASGETTLVSRTTGGGVVPAGGGVNFAAGAGPSVSADGRFVAYSTGAGAIHGGVSDEGTPAVVLFDAQEATTTTVADVVVSPTPLPSGNFTRYGGRDAMVSGDGGAVIFWSIGADYVAGDAGLDADAFVWTRATGAFERVTEPTGGGDLPNGAGTGAVGTPRLSHDARFAVFSSAQPLAAGAPADTNVVWVRDRQQRTTVAASIDSGGTVRGGNDAHVSDDGRYVVFVTFASLVAADTNDRTDVYLRDLATATTMLVSADGQGVPFAGPSHSPVMSGDGRYVAFATRGSYVVPGGPTVSNIDDVYLLDRTAGTVVEASVGPAGEALGSSFSPRLSRTGRFLVFETTASNLVDLGGPSFQVHVYLRDLAP